MQALMAQAAQIGEQLKARKEKVADPNSPFAALAALKASLEQQKKK